MLNPVFSEYSLRGSYDEIFFYFFLLLGKSNAIIFNFKILQIILQYLYNVIFTTC